MLLLVLLLKVIEEADAKEVNDNDDITKRLQNQCNPQTIILANINHNKLDVGKESGENQKRRRRP
jgi:hypothetical protein